MSAALHEHIGYLSLTGRAELYQAALSKTVHPGDTVADLGCGVGVLGIQALGSGASHVFGVDYTDAIELARQTVARLGLADRYTCIRATTFQTVLPQQVDVIICDHVGFFGVDYGIIEMLQDARRRMLKDGGRIMPRRIDLHLAAATSPAAREQVDAWSKDPVPAEFRWIAELNANCKFAHAFTADELSSAPANAGSVDLTTDVPDLLVLTAELEVTADCVIDGLAGWFNAELAEDIWMTNSPLSAEAIKRHNVFLPCRTPIAAKAGDLIKVDVRFRHDAGTIAWTIRPPGGAPAQKLSTWKSTIIAPADLAPRQDGTPSLTPRGRANRTILDLVDEQRSALEIEDLIVQHHPDVFPTEQEIRRHVRRVLAADAAA